MTDVQKEEGPRETALAFEAAAARDGWLDFDRDPVLLKYRKSVQDWHGFIRFLGLPHLRDNPDIPIHRLFVEPRLASRHVPGDEPVDRWPATESVMDAIAGRPWTVVLGDPGCGKSTLVNWLAWQFVRLDGGPWIERFGPMVPIPLVLRELRLRPDVTWDGLVAAFLEHDMAQPLAGTDLIGRLAACGQAFFLVDGIDEVASVETRAALHRALQEGRERFPACRWLLTSRIVGYEECPFAPVPGRVPGAVARRHAEGDGPVDAWIRDEALRRATGEALYVSPFSDDQMTDFALRWFRQRESSDRQAVQRGQNLLGAIRQDASTLRLARIPNLLTLMALVHRVRARLPHGRALLFSEIATAYLESIDEFRGLLKPDHPLAQKRRWLARVAFEMQQRRAAAAVSDSGEDEAARPILATGADVRAWVEQAMSESGFGRDPAAAAEFVDYVGRRSGLLLPRGQDRFAFMHLSFQEFFAAVHLSERITGPQWILDRERDTPDGAPALRRYAADPSWRETMVLLFELLADRPGWPEALYQVVFDGTDDLTARLLLLARVAVDPHSGMPEKVREEAFRRCLGSQMQEGRFEPDVGDRDSLELCGIVFSAEEELRDLVYRVFRDELLARRITSVDLLWAGMTTLAPLRDLPVDELSLEVPPSMDFSAIASLPLLKRLFLYVQQAQRLESLPLLAGLELLEIDLVDGKELPSLARWSGAPNVTSMLLFWPPSSLQGIEAFQSLHSLTLVATPLPDLGPLASLPNLRSLKVPDPESDLAEIRARLPGVQVEYWDSPFPQS